MQSTYRVKVISMGNAGTGKVDYPYFPHFVIDKLTIFIFYIVELYNKKIL